MTNNSTNLRKIFPAIIAIGTLISFFMLVLRAVSGDIAGTIKFGEDIILKAILSGIIASIIIIFIKIVLDKLKGL